MSEPVKPRVQPRPRWFLWLALPVLAAGAVYTVYQDQQTDTNAVQNVEDWAPTGWKVEKYPDLPGPYRKLGESVIYHRGETGTFSYRNAERPVSYRVAARTDTDQQVLLLETPAGEKTIAVLIREPAK